MELKDFKALVNFCRKSGILTYKSQDVEFVLSQEDPKEAKRTSKKLRKAEDSIEQRLNELSDEELLLYSASSVTDKSI